MYITLNRCDGNNSSGIYILFRILTYACDGIGDSIICVGFIIYVGTVFSEFRLAIFRRR